MMGRARARRRQSAPRIPNPPYSRSGEKSLYAFVVVPGGGVERRCVVCGKVIAGRTVGAALSSHARMHVREGKARETISPSIMFPRYLYFTRSWKRARAGA